VGSVHGRHPWLGDHPETGFFLGDYSPLKRNYLPTDYLSDSSAHNVLATVHCEAEWDRTDQVGETNWISAIHARTVFRTLSSPMPGFTPRTPPIYWNNKLGFRWCGASARSLSSWRARAKN